MLKVIRKELAKTVELFQANTLELIKNYLIKNIKDHNQMTYIE